MKHLQNFFHDKKSLSSSSNDGALDDKTVFYLFSQIITEEYGQQGRHSIVPSFYRNRIVFVKFAKSIWAQEVWQNRSRIINKVNARAGSSVVVNIKSH